MGLRVDLCGMCRIPCTKDIPMKSITFAVLLAVGPLAQAKPLSVHDELTQNRGMTEVSPGLYQRIDGSEKAYVATSQTGKQALAAHIQSRVDALTASMGKRQATPSQLQLLGQMEDAALALTQDSRKDSQSSNGSCASYALVYAFASADYGTDAYANAGIALDFGPTTPTQNEAWAWTDGAFNYDSGTGLDAAITSAYTSYSCYSAAYAQVTCPDSGGTAAFAESFRSTNVGFCVPM